MKTHIFKNAIFILASTLLIVACEKDSADENNTSKTINIKGYVQKGPFFNGSTIQINELDNSFEKKGKIYTTVTTDNKGSFALSNIERSSPYYEFCAQGFYFNEVLGDYVDAPITLYALADSADISEVNVNILTHLEKNRVEYLIKQNMSFPAAKDSAQREILSMFGFALSAMEHSEKLDISVNKEENAVLLAVSLILQGQRSVSRLVEVLQPIIVDVNEDGILNDEEIKSVLYISTKTLDLAAIRKNLEDHYKNLGVNDTIPGFEKYINAYLTSQKPFSIEDSITNISCNGAKTGKIDITIKDGTPPFTYSWSNGAKTEDITSVAAGNYRVTITDASKYVLVKDNLIISEPTEINITGNTSNATCESSDGAIDVTVSGGVPPYVYSWNNEATTADLNNISAGKYTIIVTDANQCEKTGEFEVAKNISDIIINGNTIDATCESSDGSIDITISGGTPPYMYSWSNSATTEDLDNLSAGNYTIIVTDANLCSKTKKFIVDKTTSEISISSIVINASTWESSDGSINITVSEGSPPYLYDWSNGSTTEDLTNINEGIYSITVTDANLCAKSEDIVLYGTVSDHKGIIYKTIMIGSQIWLAENIRTIEYSDGMAIPNITDNDQWRYLTTPAYCWYENNEDAYKYTYGALYNFYSVKTGKLCPVGWHVPSDGEWTTLTDYLGGSEIAGNKLKEAGELHWASPNSGATNESGFTALPGGMRGVTQFSSKFTYIGSHSTWWSSSEFDSSYAKNRYLNYMNAYVEQSYGDSGNGHSVRCVKD